MCDQVRAGEEMVTEFVYAGFLVRTLGGKSDAAAYDPADGDPTKRVQLMANGF